MRFLPLAVLSTWIVGFCGSAWAVQSGKHVSLCSIQESPANFLQTRIEVNALIFVGPEIGQIQEGKCLFRFAFGDDYQTFGARFRVERDAQWDLMRRLLNTPDKCAVHARIVKARIQGTVIRIPATGTTPEDEMPMEIVIQSVSRVEHVPIKCSPDIHATDPLPRESGHADPPKQQ